MTQARRRAHIAAHLAPRGGFSSERATSARADTHWCRGGRWWLANPQSRRRCAHRRPAFQTALSRLARFPLSVTTFVVVYGVIVILTPVVVGGRTRLRYVQFAVGTDLHEVSARWRYIRRRRSVDMLNHVPPLMSHELLARACPIHETQSISAHPRYQGLVVTIHCDHGTFGHDSFYRFGYRLKHLLEVIHLARFKSL